MNRVILACVVAALAIFQPAMAQSRPKVEIVEVPSHTASDTEFLSGRSANGTPVILQGKLQLPVVGDGQPVVVILHGSGGDKVLGYDAWTRALNAAGIATFRLDSYTRRGLSEIFSDQSRLGEFAVVYDAYRVLDVLAAHPSIDPDRIALMGFSRGGIGALYSALTRFETLYGSDGAQFAAHIPFYPPCNFELENELQTTGRPIRAFHGEADNWNPLAACEDYIARLAEAGADATITAYPKASHAFDNPSAPAPFANPKAQTSRACYRREAAGTLMNVETDLPFAWTDTCVQTAPLQHFNAPAAEVATKAVVSFLREVFELD